MPNTSNGYVKDEIFIAAPLFSIFVIIFFVFCLLDFRNGTHLSSS
jgi:hypothetical protein